MDNNNLSVRNNIYTGIGPWNGHVHVSDGAQYCLWDVGTTYFENGQGNIQLLSGQPLFADKTDLMGADGIPFTQDDGFRLIEGSPAINNGIDVGFTYDIMGNPISGNPDIGAYEYTDVNSVSFTDPLPENFQLYQNYPNPFNPTTKIGFRIADFGFVSLKVYDVLGNEIATLVNEEKPVGSYEVEFDADLLPSGIYFYQLQTESFVQTRKMLLLK
jgi:hypothetical protein